MPIYTPEDAGQKLTDLITEAAGPLGISHVNFADDVVIPSYPAVIVQPGVVSRELHATHQFRLILAASVWVYHAKATQSRSQRTLADLQLVTGIRELIHEAPNTHLGFDENNAKNIIFGFFTDEEPGATVRGKTTIVLATRMVWAGQQVKPF